VIIGIDRTRVNGVSKFAEAIRERNSFLITLRRGSQTVILPVR
jgi:hypothetical protein